MLKNASTHTTSLTTLAPSVGITANPNAATNKTALEILDSGIFVCRRTDWGSGKGGEVTSAEGIPRQSVRAVRLAVSAFSAMGGSGIGIGTWS